MLERCPFQSRGHRRHEQNGQSVHLYIIWEQNDFVILRIGKEKKKGAIKENKFEEKKKLGIK